MRKLRWLCRLGMHDWFRVGNVEICRDCQAVRQVWLDTGPGQ